MKKVSLSSPIEDKIAWAEEAFRRYGGRLLNDTGVAGLLARLGRCIEASRKEMANARIDRLCAQCERHEGGSCCGAGLEKKMDSWLLLINLLLGVELPERAYDSKSCFFLTPEGCLLKARHVICVNYLCRKIIDQVDPEKITLLREREGEELGTLFLLQESVKRALADQVPGSAPEPQTGDC